MVYIHIYIYGVIRSYSKVPKSFLRGKVGRDTIRILKDHKGYNQALLKCMPNLPSDHPIVGEQFWWLILRTLSVNAPASPGNLHD